MAHAEVAGAAMSTKVPIANLIAAFQTSLAADVASRAALKASLPATYAQIKTLDQRIATRMQTIADLQALQAVEPLDVETV